MSLRRHRAKLCLVMFSIFVAIACSDSKPTRYSITDSKAYEASLFRQNCAICHGPEGEGKVTPEGLVVPNMREGPLLKKVTHADIRQQITDGGNGMTPFRDILSAREVDLMTDFVETQLRANNK